MESKKTIASCLILILLTAFITLSFIVNIAEQSSKAKTNIKQYLMEK